MLAERGRVHAATSNNDGRRCRRSPTVQRAQTPDEAIVALNQFDDELAIWIILGMRDDVVRRPMLTRRRARIIARQQDEIRLETIQTTASAALYDTVIRPLSQYLEGVKHITFVPDSTYQDVSFSALWDRSGNRFLVEIWTLSEAPSVALLASADS